ncbi:MAG: hypothetical protein KA163_02335 [Bacteroidia bacterium]|nr:hypothetical protein [Bacteroidia bacterium]
MKTKSIIISAALLIVLSIILTSFITKANLNSAKTEEYAIVDVISSGKRKYIRITKGTEPTTETEWKKEKTDDRDDYTPVITVLNQLNEQGFELLNTSLAYSTIGGGQIVSYGEPRHTFMMVKKVK